MTAHAVPLLPDDPSPRPSRRPRRTSASVSDEPIPPQEPEPAERESMTVAAGQSTIEIFADLVDPDRHDGRHQVRRTILDMVPVARPRPPRPVPPAGRGVFWGLTAANGLTMAIRTRDFATVAQALADAYRILAYADEIELVPVARRDDAAQRKIAFWCTLDQEVVLVSGQAHVGRGGALLRELRSVGMPASQAPRPSRDQ